MSEVLRQYTPPRPERSRWREVVLRADWGLVVAALGLSALGVLLVWSSTRQEAGTALAARQAINVVIGVALAAMVARTDLRLLRALAPWLYLAGIAGLLLVLGPLGTEVNGSRSWIRLPVGFSIQPAELAKVGLVIGLALVLAEGRDTTRSPAWRAVLAAWVLGGLPVLLILGQPDLGSALVLVAMTLAAVAASGAALRWTVLALTATVGAAVAAIRIPLLDPYQIDRLLAFRDPTLDPEGIGYQTTQASRAIAGGGWTGTGLGEGPITQGGAIPFQETDFIFSVVGEELGFVGSAALVAVLLFLVVRALVVALRTEDGFVRIIAVGIAAWFAFQTFQNIGMNLRLLPVTGLPLPLVSYGGSSVFACWLAIGLLVSAQRAASR